MLAQCLSKSDGMFPGWCVRTEYESTICGQQSVEMNVQPLRLVTAASQVPLPRAHYPNTVLHHVHMLHSGKSCSFHHLCHQNKCKLHQKFPTFATRPDDQSGQHKTIPPGINIVLAPHATSPTWSLQRFTAICSVSTRSHATTYWHTYGKHLPPYFLT